MWLHGSVMLDLAQSGGSLYDTRQFDLKSDDSLIADGKGLLDELIEKWEAAVFEEEDPFITVFDIILCEAPVPKVLCSGILADVFCSIDECQALVLAPNRELVQRIAELMPKPEDEPSVKVHACVGGKNNSHRCKDMRVLLSGVHVVVGTPGRVLNMLTRQSLRPDCIKTLLLFGTDKMLSCGFKDQVYDILKLLPSNVQLASFSATLPPEVLGMMKKFMNKPVVILVNRDWVAAQVDCIKQFYVIVEKEEGKFETMCRIYEHLFAHCVIFVNTPCNVDWLADKMRSRGHVVSATHRDMDQNERDTILREFRSGLTCVLITTDLLVRAIDRQKVSLIINYDRPNENYDRLSNWHGGRFGREGVAIDFITSEDKERLSDDIQRLYNVVVVEEWLWDD